MSLGPMGMSSGMDINSMVSKIVNAERVPKQQRIDNQRMQIDTNISAYGRLRESLDTMKSLMANFRHEKAFAVRKVDTSDDEIVSATATTDAIAGKYAIDVLQLAQSHKVASDIIPDDAIFGPGKLQVSLGDKSFDIDVGSRSKLVDVVRGINGAKDNLGVRASIINDVQGPRLILASNLSGKDNNITIKADSESDNALKLFEFKSLEDRVKDLEAAQKVARSILPPSFDEQAAVNAAGGINIAAGASEMAMAADQFDDQLQNKQNALDQTHSEQVNSDQENHADENPERQQANDSPSSLPLPPRSLLPQDNIPGWTNTASGTLLDSYRTPEPELDAIALEKSQDVPGWSNTASGTLTASYVTVKEAREQLEQELAEEKKAIEQAVAENKITPEEAKVQQRAKLTVEEREHLEEMDKVEVQLKQAQESFETYQGMSEVQAAQDSIVLLDGIAELASHNNIIEDAIEGVDLTLKRTSDANKPPAEIGVEYDRRSVRSDIEQFVASYNQFHQISKELASVDPLTGQKGPLAGDSVVRTADSRLKSVFSSAVEQAPEDLKSLTEFGVTTTMQGKLEINYAMLDRQLNNNFNKLEDFFGGNQGFAKKVEDAIHSMTGVTGTIRTREQSLVEQNYRLFDDQSSLDRRMDGLEKRTHARFSAMQEATGKMRSQLGGMMNAMG
ncbi:flagellar filament capping protein FliD [Vibrio sp. 10N.286.49.B3]|uniref:flagellar filament capping protein FliD n=1 Tax=Vibrio sp. 10N.286.49.B3 TaxID=1880855 RepID=UPI000C840872|nr:flagellar filament capping protein FliD [Vibrio sp. 10N.286.49.B3]PMH41048.1 flagellar filament capping protein FliD [Vibrio sp. 10N.286.49.B3]